MSSIIQRFVPAAVVLALAAIFCAQRSRAAPAAASTSVPILDNNSFWRMHTTLEAPVLESAPGAKPLTAILYSQPWLNEKTSEPAADWTQSSFDDFSWPRLPALLACHAPYVSRLCLRGKFAVSDPAAVKNLHLDLTFCGGAIVSLNGHEIARNSLPQGPATIADSYPAAAFLPDENNALRHRIVSVAVPANFLQKGVNVLAIEIIRAPYNQAPDLPKEKNAGSEKLYAIHWNTCDLISVRLSASAAAGIVPNVARPAGLQVWNNDIINSDYDLDFGDPNDSLRAVAIFAARNGVGSGKLVVGCNKPLKDFHVTIGDLQTATGAIPAADIEVRYGFPWGREHMGDEKTDVYSAPAKLLGALADAPPPNASVVPVWFTVKVPASAAAGLYKGTATVHADGFPDITAPLEVTVFPYTVPDPQNFQTWVELIESPDTLSVEYGDPLWSDKHWQHIAESFRFFNEIGSRVLYIPLIAHANLGNAESMVRWIEKPGGKFDYDFSIMDKYLDVAEKNMGTPKIVVFNVWDVYMIPSRDNGGSASGGTSGHRRMVGSFSAAQAAKLGSGPLVTVVDPATKKTENIYLPVYADKKSEALWQPLFDALKKHMAARKLEKQMMLGMVTDALPTKEEVQFFKTIAPGMPWVSEGHGGFAPRQLLQNIAPVGYQTTVWMTRFADDVNTHGVLTRPEDHIHGWQQPQLLVDFERNPDLFEYPASRWLFFGESNITGYQRGMGRIAGDYWLAIKDKHGRRAANVTARFPESAWMNLNICNPVLAPGPDGPVATTRFEALREGVEECEARIAIEKVLTNPALKAKLHGDLAAQCQKMLDARLPIMWRSLSNLQLTGTRWGDARLWRWTAGNAGHIWFLGSGWQQRNNDLYTLAGEVQAAVR